MDETVPVTFTIPDNTDPVPVYESAGGIPVQVVTVPTLMSDGQRLQAPVPVIDAEGPVWLAVAAVPVAGI